MDKPTIQGRIGAAAFMAVFGAERSGARTRQQLMWPFTEFSDDDVKRAAARLLASLHTATVDSLPEGLAEAISKDLDAYLSFALGEGWPDLPVQGAKAKDNLSLVLDVLEYSVMRARSDIVGAGPRMTNSIFTNLERRVAAVRAEVTNLLDTGALVDQGASQCPSQVHTGSSTNPMRSDGS